MYIKVGALDVPVIRKELDEGVWGQYNPYPVPSIWIQEGLDPKHEALTLLHEIIECIVDTYGLQVSEGAIRVLENVLGTIAMENPEAVIGWVSRLSKPKFDEKI
jgi:hypothetical protein